MIPYRHGLLAAVMIGIASPASAASIIVTAPGPVGGTGSSVVWLSGEIKQGDETVFAALPSTNSLVTLSSDGGEAVAAMLIGETIRQRGWSTAVIHSTCASSCALIWLGDTRRFVTRDAMVGFHGAYDAVTHAVSGPANAVIGMYMHELRINTGTGGGSRGRASRRPGSPLDSLRPAQSEAGNEGQDQEDEAVGAAP